MFILGLILGASIITHSQEIPEKIIGTNDMISVSDDAGNIPLRYRSLVDAFGITDIGCTATHIGHGIVLTAGHCFWAPAIPLINQSCKGSTVSWGLRGTKAAYLVSQCENIIMAQKSPLGDFAIFQVSPAPTAFISPDLRRHAAIGDTLTLFSHPEYMPLQWSQLCGFERTQDPELPPKFLLHQCDTNPGSSGAAMINAISLKIVAIHDGGHADENHKGMNYGTFILSSPLGDKLRELGF